jgi:hypothetical protein
MIARRPALTLLIGTAILATGCKQIATIGILTSPRQIQKAEFAFSERRLAIFIESARPGEANPVFNEALHAKLIEIFRVEGVTQNVVPYDQVARLRTANPDFSRWSLQRIGRTLGADQVLYVRIESLHMQAAPDHPLLEPEVRLRFKVIGVDEAPDTARQWPGRDEPRGRVAECKRQAREATDSIVVDAETVKLAKDTAYYVAAPFHDVDLEEKFPQER